MPNGEAIRKRTPTFIGGLPCLQPIELLHFNSLWEEENWKRKGRKFYSHSYIEKIDAKNIKKAKVGVEKGKKTIYIYLSCTPRLTSGEWKKVGNASLPACLPRPSQLVPGTWAGGSSPDASCSLSSLAAWISFMPWWWYSFCSGCGARKKRPANFAPPVSPDAFQPIKNY